MSENIKSAKNIPFETMESIKAKLETMLSTNRNGITGGLCQGADTSPVANEDPLQGLSSEIEWQIVWLQAIARSWADPAFRAVLIREPRTALFEAFGYSLPPLLDLVVFDAKEAGWEPPLVGGGPNHWCLPKTVVVMPLPPAPADEKQQVVALAAYNATGQAYPFTCCC
jgi:ribosomally synthesized peptide (two-chain TOMM family)